ncbi:MAG: hypothetical protein HQK72_06735 [Desulfamplus sp.]|nr:hypothetical protein [Desulfamplus sp.]
MLPEQNKEQNGVDIEPLIIKLAALLKADDSEAVDYFESVKSNLLVAISIEEYENLEKALEGYELDNALNILQPFIDKFNIVL